MGVIDAQMKLMLSKIADSIDLEKLDTGMYFIKVINNKSESITRLIKQ